MIQYVQIRYQNGYILLLVFFIWLRNYTVVYKRVWEVTRSKCWLLVLSKAKVGWFCFVFKYCISNVTSKVSPYWVTSALPKQDRRATVKEAWAMGNRGPFCTFLHRFILQNTIFLKTSSLKLYKSPQL